MENKLEGWGDPIEDLIKTNPDVRWTERKPENTTKWSENKRWLVAVIGLLSVIGIMCTLAIYNLFWYAILGVLGVWLLGVLLLASKDIVDDLIDGW
jgi:protein-S-isoprenylcysteine O-methyltransferase Ste14